MNEMQEELKANVEAHDIEIDFGRIFKRLWHFAWLIAVLAVLGAVLMYGVTKLVLPPEYKSTASVYIHDKNFAYSNGEEDSVDGKPQFNTSNQYIATYLKNTYSRTLTSNTTLNIVIDNLQKNAKLKDYEEVLKKYEPKHLRAVISVGYNDYPFCDITVTMSDPVLATYIANEAASVLQDQVSKVVGGSALTPIDAATVPEKKSGPNTLLNVILGFAAGFAISCLVIVIMELANNKINNEEYLLNKYGISVLASISDYEVMHRKGYQYYKKNKYKYYGEAQGGENA